jgi:hypothetical protein
MFETSGLLRSATEKFRLFEPSTWTLEQFKQEINRGNAERLCRLTTGVAGYHGALPTTASTAAVAQVAKPCPAYTDIMCDGIQLYYCWSHGLSGYAKHNSKTCVNRKAGHIASATLTNQQGGVYIRIPGQKNSYLFYLDSHSKPCIVIPHIHWQPSRAIWTRSAKTSGPPRKRQRNLQEHQFLTQTKLTTGSQ